MLERISEHPFVFFGGCLVWIPVSIWVIALVQWMIQGDIEVLFGLPGVVAGMALGALTLDPPNPALSPVFFATVVLTVFLFPVLRSTLSARELAQIDLDALERAYEALGQKPDNVGARLRIARIVASRGLPGHAAAIGDAALRGLTGAYYDGEARQIGLWRAQGAYPGASRSIVCVECGASNPPGDLYCRYCRAPFLLHWAQGRWAVGGVAGKLVAGWIAAVAGIAGIPAAAVSLEPAWAIGVIVGVLLAVLWLLWSAFRPSRRQIRQ